MSYNLRKDSLNVYDATIGWFSMVNIIFAEFRLIKTDEPDGI